MRRLNIEGLESVLFCNLKQVLLKECERLGMGEPNFKIYWEDDSADLIGIENTNGLLIALEETQGPVHKIIVQLKMDKDSGRLIIVF